MMIVTLKNKLVSILLKALEQESEITVSNIKHNDAEHTDCNTSLISFAFGLDLVVSTNGDFRSVFLISLIVVLTLRFDDCATARRLVII